MSNELESVTVRAMAMNLEESFGVDGVGYGPWHDETETEPPSSTNPQ